MKRLFKENSIDSSGKKEKGAPVKPAAGNVAAAAAMNETGNEAEMICRQASHDTTICVTTKHQILVNRAE